MAHILILNGNDRDNHSAFDSYLRRLGELLVSSMHRVTLMALREMDILPCQACRSCWVKTPGECVLEDDMRYVGQTYIQADFVLLASPVHMGFSSALLQTAIDRLRPLLHPYTEVDRGQVHYMARYTSYPPLGLVLGKRAECDEHDLGIIQDLYQQIALSLKTRLSFVRLTQEPVEEVVRAFDRL
ncbi:MAG: flavodoxin family protein [Chloroflexia bacterium]|nr:flavodoxin family protein [Chloroflexia bacterium]